MKKKKPEYFYNPTEGSAPLSIYWYDGQKGDAVEANNEIGVGFFGKQGELLGVIFDDVKEKLDNQILEFDSVKVTASTKKGKVSFQVIPIVPQKSKKTCVSLEKKSIRKSANM